MVLTQNEILEAEAKKQRIARKKAAQKLEFEWYQTVKPEMTDDEIKVSMGTISEKVYKAKLEKAKAEKGTKKIIQPNIKVTDENYTVKELDELIKISEFDVDLELKKTDKIAAINKILKGE